MPGIAHRRVRVRERARLGDRANAAGPCAAAAPPCARRSWRRPPRARRPRRWRARRRRARRAGRRSPPKLVKPITTRAPGRAADERPAGIALAGVAAALRDSGAQHCRRIVAVAVHLGAGGVGLDADHVWRSASGKSPAAEGVVEPQPIARRAGPDDAGGAVVELAAGSDGLRELEQREIVDERARIETGVDAHAQHVDAGRGGALEAQAAGDDSSACSSQRNRFRGDAVGRRSAPRAARRRPRRRSRRRACR